MTNHIAIFADYFGVSDNVIDVLNEVQVAIECAILRPLVSCNRDTIDLAEGHTGEDYGTYPLGVTLTPVVAANLQLTLHTIYTNRLNVAYEANLYRRRQRFISREEYETKERELMEALDIDCDVARDAIKVLQKYNKYIIVYYLKNEIIVLSNPYHLDQEIVHDLVNHEQKHSVKHLQDERLDDFPEYPYVHVKMIYND